MTTTRPPGDGIDEQLRARLHREAADVCGPSEMVARVMVAAGPASPIRRAGRRTRPWMPVLAAVVVALVAAATYVIGRDDGRPSSQDTATASRRAALRVSVDGAGAPNTFLATYSYSRGSNGQDGDSNGTYLSVFDAGTGEHRADLMHWTGNQQPGLTGFSRDRAGDVWIAQQNGPVDRNPGTYGMADPVPGTCGGTISRIDHRTGTVDVVVTIGRDNTVRQPVLSPDGQRLAYVSTSCAEPQIQTVVIKDLHSDQTWSVRISQAQAYRPAWTADGHLLFTAVPTVSTKERGVGSGFVVAAGDSDQSFSLDQLRFGQAGCDVAAVASDPEGLVVAQGCPETTDNGSVRQFTGMGPAVSTVALPASANGTAMSVSPNGTLLVSSWDTATVTTFVSVILSGKVVRQFGYTDPGSIVGSPVW